MSDESQVPLGLMRVVNGSPVSEPFYTSSGGDDTEDRRKGGCYAALRQYGDRTTISTPSPEAPGSP